MTVSMRGPSRDQVTQTSSLTGTNLEVPCE